MRQNLRPRHRILRPLSVECINRYQGMFCPLAETECAHCRTSGAGELDLRSLVRASSLAPWSAASSAARSVTRADWESIASRLRRLGRNQRRDHLDFVHQRSLGPSRLPD